MGSEEIVKHRGRQRDSRFLFILFCPLLCGIFLPVIGVVFLLTRHGYLHEAALPIPVYPVCNDPLSQSGDSYVRPFARPRDFGRPGLSHVTLHGAVHHGAKELEIWQQAFAPGAGTPVHRHDCEEAFVVLAGNGTLFTRHPGEAARSALAFGANTSLFVPPNHVHQLVNTGEETLQVIVTISKPPINVFVYDGWEADSGAAQLQAPYLFDRECADSDGSDAGDVTGAGLADAAGGEGREEVTPGGGEAGVE